MAFPAKCPTLVSTGFLRSAHLLLETLQSVEFEAETEMHDNCEPLAQINLENVHIHACCRRKERRCYLSIYCIGRIPRKRRVGGWGAGCLFKKTSPPRENFKFKRRSLLEEPISYASNDPFEEEWV
ncbi:hypothetical protein CDAR_378231 [Caerostris darwini]|uniref:Uncharacterized protein n=1 Tax=Caerostris darwini TaxID=1538125 RepID=A0AAV4PK05_9ARAC|nr:hypothetical protein CDAR_378231 [Caerostris darwini]